MKKLRTLVAIPLALLSVAWMGQYELSGTVATNGASAQLAACQTAGWFQKIQFSLPPGLTNLEVTFYDFDDAILLQTNLAGNAILTTSLTLITNVLHGSFSVVGSNALTSTTVNPGSNVTFDILQSDDR
jgi:hypothetical protein